MVNLVADHEITEAAQAIDAEVWPVHLQIRNGMTADGDWYALRDKVEARRRDFVNIARKRLSSAGPPLRRRTMMVAVTWAAYRAWAALPRGVTMRTGT